MKDNKEVVRGLFESLNQRDLDAAEEAYAEDVTYHGMEASGRDQVKRKVADMLSAFPDLVISVEDLVAEGDRVVVRLEARGTHSGEFEGIPPTGRSFKAGEFDLIRLEGGRIKEVWHLYDSLSFLQQIGMFPQPGGTQA